MPLATPPMGLGLTKSITLHIKLEDELTALLSHKMAYMVQASC